MTDSYYNIKYKSLPKTNVTFKNSMIKKVTSRPYEKLKSNLMMVATGMIDKQILRWWSPIITTSEVTYLLIRLNLMLYFHCYKLTNFLPGGMDCIKDCIRFIREIDTNRYKILNDIMNSISALKYILCCVITQQNKFYYWMYLWVNIHQKSSQKSRAGSATCF